MNAKQLAQKLRRRCFSALGSVEDTGTRKFVDSLETGDAYIYVGRIYADLSTWKFEIVEEEQMASGFRRTVWSCDVHVTRELEVFAETTTGPVPKNVLTCAIGGR